MTVPASARRAVDDGFVCLTGYTMLQYFLRRIRATHVIFYNSAHFNAYPRSLHIARAIITEAVTRQFGPRHEEALFAVAEKGRFCAHFF